LKSLLYVITLSAVVVGGTVAALAVGIMSGTEEGGTYIGLGILGLMPSIFLIFVLARLLRRHDDKVSIGEVGTRREGEGEAQEGRPGDELGAVAVIQVNRPGGFIRDAAAEYAVYVDGAMVGRLRPGQHLEIRVLPGRHLVQARVGGGSSVELPVELGVDERINLVVTPAQGLPNPLRAFSRGAWIDLREASDV
jgi:hypothetical protein